MPCAVCIAQLTQMTHNSVILHSRYDNSFQKKVKIFAHRKKYHRKAFGSQF
jgi:hypothetical protein